MVKTDSDGVPSGFGDGCNPEPFSAFEMYGDGAGDGNGTGVSYGNNTFGNGNGDGDCFGDGYGDGDGSCQLDSSGEAPYAVALIINDDPLTLACQSVTMFSYRG